MLIEFANGVADDIATWGRLGLLGKKVTESAGRFADWCWFLSTLVGLVENGVERNMIEGLTGEGALPSFLCDTRCAKLNMLS